MEKVTAVEMAQAVRIDPRRFRAALRAEGLSWHRHDERWTVEAGSDRHLDMERVLKSLASR